MVVSLNYLIKLGRSQCYESDGVCRVLGSMVFTFTIVTIVTIHEPSSVFAPVVCETLCVLYIR